jgi:regulator of protease activity HflC (stomatin/prohibitin superfamily)
MLDAETDQWGMKVDAVAIKHVGLPQTMQRAMAGQAEAERARRAKIIAAEGEFQAASRLAQAAEIMGQHPIALPLRFLQTLAGVAAENNATLVVPLPIDLITPLIDLIERRHPPHSASTASETLPPTRAGESGTPPSATP